MRRNRRQARRGAAAVEFALVAPVFFAVVLAIIEFGRMVMVQQVLTNAAREGCRLAVVPGTSYASVQTRVATYLVNGCVISGTGSLNAGSGQPSMTVSPNPPSSAASGSQVTVGISVPFSTVSWLPTPIYLGSTTLSTSSSMRSEN